MRKFFKIDGFIAFLFVIAAIGVYFAFEEPQPSELEIVIAQVQACEQMKRAINSVMAEAEADNYLLQMQKELEK